MIELHTFDDPRAQSDALAKAVGDALQASLAARGAASTDAAHHATLAVSGGTSPRPFLQTLSSQALDWAHIDVTLVDDRWVPETDAASNARLVRETLLQNAASAAYFWPLVDTAQTLETHIADLNGDAQRRAARRRGAWHGRGRPHGVDLRRCPRVGRRDHHRRPFHRRASGQRAACAREPVDVGAASTSASFTC